MNHYRAHEGVCLTGNLERANLNAEIGSDDEPTIHSANLAQLRRLWKLKLKLQDRTQNSKSLLTRPNSYCDTFFGIFHEPYQVCSLNKTSFIVK